MSESTRKNLVNEENYVQIQGWMVSKLNLKGNELLIFAIIYGFCQIEGHWFTGSLQYLADWTNTTKQSCINCLKTLLDKKYIIKEELNNNGIKFCKYTINFDGIKKFLICLEENRGGGIKKSLTNNINNINNIIYPNNINTQSINTEKNNTDNIDKSKSKKSKKEIEKEQLEKDLVNQIDLYIKDNEIKELVTTYLAIRKTKGLTLAQWIIILEDFKKECMHDKQYSINCLRKAIAGGWSQIVFLDTFKGNLKTSYGNKNSFDNTATHKVTKGISEMTEEEKAEFYENQLAKDENGNFLKF